MTFTRNLIIAIVILAVIFSIWLLLGGGRKQQPVPNSPRKPLYKSMMAPGGVVPMKVLVMMEDGSVLYREPNAATAAQDRLGALTIWYPFEERDGYTRIGKSPLNEKTTGWVRSAELAKWTTKEGILPNHANFWSDRAQAGTSVRPTYRENPDFDVEQPFPVLVAADSQYQVALISQNIAGDELLVATAWTQKLRVPDDALFYYLTTREELKEDLAEITTTILEINSGGSAEHPVLKYLKKHVDITVARDIVSDQDDANWLRRVLLELRGPRSVAGLQEAELRRDAQKMKNRLEKMKRFYDTPGFWNEQGQGWLPSNLLTAD
jgi:hypothetical protein